MASQRSSLLALCSSGSSHSPSSPAGCRSQGSSNLPRQLTALFFHARQAATWLRGPVPDDNMAPGFPSSTPSSHIDVGQTASVKQQKSCLQCMNDPSVPISNGENPAARPAPAPWESSSQPESHCASAARTGLREALAARLPCLGLFMWKDGTARDSVVKGVSEETRILNPNSLVLRLKTLRPRLNGGHSRSHNRGARIR